MAAAAALLALSGLVGTGVFLAVRDDSDPPPTTTTTSSTTTSTVPDAGDVFAAVARSLEDDVSVSLTSVEARCIAATLLTVIEPERLTDLVGTPSPLASLTQVERDGIVRGVVGCVTPEQAAAILGSPSTTSAPVSLPDEGS